MELEIMIFNSEGLLRDVWTLVHPHVLQPYHRDLLRLIRKHRPNVEPHGYVVVRGLDCSVNKLYKANEILHCL